jgi:hypothetical protein
MANPMRFRISMASIMMLVVAAAAASALFTKIVGTISGEFGEWKYDVPAVIIIAVALTAIALGAFRNHSGIQMMIQATGAYLGFLSMIWIIEQEHYRIAIYWFQILFAGLVVFPFLARRFARARSGVEDDPGWLARATEALPLAFGNMILVLAGAWFQWTGFMYLAMVVQMRQAVAPSIGAPVAVEPDYGLGAGGAPGSDGSEAAEAARIRSQNFDVDGGKDKENP